MVILNFEICVNVVNWIHIVLINRHLLMILNIEISMNLVNLIQTVLINRFFYILMATLAIVLQCPSWPNKANIRIVVSFYYSFILVLFKTEKPANCDISRCILLTYIKPHLSSFVSKSKLLAHIVFKNNAI